MDRTGFVDEVQAHVKAGDGGAGSVSMRREAHVDRGGPDGGSGGRGGDVWFVADANVSSLLGFRDEPHRRATNGVHGMGKVRNGANGVDVLVPVPVGTVVRTLDGELVADLTAPGDRFLAAEGGRGGRGNKAFLSNRRRAPTFAEQGEVGEDRWLDLELKLMADVALVGFPNAGKSTLISRISAAKPKIAAYPFTTLEPHLGVVRQRGSGPQGRDMVVADVPGLIEGASDGKGLGHQFLRHIERARALCVLIDLTADTDGGLPPEEQEAILLRELGAYRPELLERERIVVGTKADRHDADPSWDGLFVSALTGEGLPELVGALLDAVDRARAAEAATGEEATFVVHRLVPDSIAVERSMDGGWEVLGKAARRAVAMNDLTNRDALQYVQGRLKGLGVDKALARAGAKQGDLVRIGDLVFEYEED